jgi:hypothetical protein
VQCLRLLQVVEFDRAGVLLTAIGDPAYGEHRDHGEDAEHDDDDQQLDQREAVVRAAIVGRSPVHTRTSATPGAMLTRDDRTRHNLDT